MGGGLNYTMPGFAEGGGTFKQMWTDSNSPESDKHAKWYNEELPKLLDKHQAEIGLKRVEGLPRDTAAEFAGAADWAQRAPANYNQDVYNATAYQYLNHPLATKNRNDNIVQDKAGSALGVCNPLMSKDDLVNQAVKYSLTHDFNQ